MYVLNLGKIRLPDQQCAELLEALEWDRDRLREPQQDPDPETEEVEPLTMEDADAWVRQFVREQLRQQVLYLLSQRDRAMSRPAFGERMLDIEAGEEE